jgi:hypothetical protein
MTQRIVGALLLTLLPGASPHAMQQPGPRRIEPQAPECRTCQIVVTRLATLGQDSTLLGTLSMAIARDRIGRFLVSSTDMSRIAVYDGAGRELHSFGREGSGPGEFRGILEIKIAVDDSIYVSDLARRVSVFAPNHQFVRSFNFAGQFSRAALLPAGGFISETRRGALTEYCRDGKEQASRPVSPGVVQPPNPTCRHCDARSLVAARMPGRFWSWVKNRYEIEQIDLSGVVHQRLVRGVAWFQPWLSETALVPTPVLSNVREDTTGHLWVTVHLPNPRWVASSGPSRVATAGDYDRLYESLLEVIDPNSGRLIASARLPGMVSTTRDGILWKLRDLPDGRVVMDVFRTELQGTSIPR